MLKFFIIAALIVLPCLIWTWALRIDLNWAFGVGIPTAVLFTFLYMAMDHQQR